VLTVSELMPSGCGLQGAHDGASWTGRTSAQEAAPVFFLAVRRGDAPTRISFSQNDGREAATRERESSGSTGHLVCDHI
jgi:hypothetical protein